MVSAAGKPDHANGGGKPPKNEEPSGPLARSVCIDPGHGGTNIGTRIGEGDNEILEKNLNLEVAKKLQTLLEEKEFSAYMTRTEDVTKTNNDRYTYCNQKTDATTLISIHHNGSSDSSVDYSLGLYHQKTSEQLASVVGQSVANEFGQGDTFRTDRFPSGVLIKSEMPSMMSEGYFLTNENRFEQLKEDRTEMVNREANALLSGIISYYESN